MHDPNEIPRSWKVGFVAGLLAILLLVLSVLAWFAYHVGGEACTSEAHFSDLCDPYLPGVPGKEGR